MRASAGSRGPYDAFLSYSHAADGELAPALQRGLHRFAKPWNQPRALRVFRDQTSLAAGADLWTTIERALGSSRYFILLASPESSRSPWVRREIAYWKARHRPDTMLIVLTDGEIVWDHGHGDFDPELTTALPDDLRGWFEGEPLWVDLRWAGSGPALSLEQGRFREAVGMLAAAVHGVSKDELDSEEVRQHARTVRLRRAGVSALTVLLVIALVMANLANEGRQEAEKQRRQAEEQRRLATVRALQAEAENVRGTDPLTSLRLSMAALRIKPTEEAREGLVTTLQHTRLAGSSVTRTGEPYEATYNADGTLLATVAVNARTVGLWDTRDTVRPRRLAELTGHREPVLSRSFRADGKLLATIANAGPRPDSGAAWSSSLMLWDLTDRDRPRRVLHRKGLHDVRAAAFSPDGRTMAVVAGRANGTLQLWDVADPSAPRRLTGPLDAVDSDTAMFSPDGRTLVTGSGWFTAKDGSLDPDTVTHHSGWTTWDVRDPREPRVLTRRPLFGTAVFSRAAPVLAVNHANTLTLWDLRSPAKPRKLKGFAHKDQVQSAAFSPDGRSLVVSVLDGTAFLRDVGDPSRPGEPVLLGEQEKWVDAIAFSRDGRTVSLADGSGRLTRWLVGGRAPARTATLTMDSIGLMASAFSPDGRGLAVSATGGAVWLWDTSDPARPRRTAQLTGQLQIAGTVAFNRDGTVLAVGSQAGELTQQGKITLWDTSEPGEPRQLAEIRTRSGVSALAFGPRRQTLAAVGSQRFGASWAGLWDVRDPRRPARTWLSDPYEPEAPDPDSAGSDLGSDLPYMGNTPAVFGPDGTTLALPDALWDVTDPAAPTRLPTVHTSDPGASLKDGYDAAAFRADGRELATSSWSTVSVWSVSTEDGRRLLTSVDTAEDLTRIDFHPEGHLVVTGDRAGRAQLWAVGGTRPPTRATTLTDTTAEVADVRFTRDGKTLAVTLDSGTVELWDMGDLPAIAADPAGVACGITGTGLSREEWREYAPGLPYEATCPER